MRTSILLLCYAFTTLLGTVSAYPGMKGVIQEIKKRADVGTGGDTGPDNGDGDQPPIIFGDLQNGVTSAVGQSIYNILMRTESATSLDNSYTVPGRFGTAACAKDTCCVWYWIAQDLKAAFTGPTGRCNAVARAAVRLGFHDAGTWSLPNSKNGMDFGGADGSIILSGTELNRPENNGLQIIAALALAEQKKYPGVSVADVIQFGATMAVVVCPLGPRIRSFVGRKDSSKAAPDGLLPGVNDGADKLIKLFEDKTIHAHDLVALLGAHSTSQQFFVDKTKFAFPQDTTPGVWVSFLEPIGIFQNHKQLIRT
jgi:hypothetical protein